MSIRSSVSFSLKANRSVYTVGGGGAFYANWCQATEAKTMEEASIVMWSGGEDIGSELYGARRHPSTYTNPERDAYEVKAFNRARALGKPLIGICRGCQFLTAMSGGKLVQDQPNPLYIHPIRTYDDKTIYVTSTHHQAPYPWGLPANQFKVLGWSKGVSRYHWGEHDGDELVIGRAPEDKEVEVVYYPETKALSIQSHPESVFSDAMEGDPDAIDYINWCRATLDAHLAGTL